MIFPRQLVCLLFVVTATSSPGATDSVSKTAAIEPSIQTAGSIDWVAAPVSFMGQLFPPTLIMQRQRDINLSDEQAEAIKAEMRKFQSEVVDIQWELQSHQSELSSLLEADVIDLERASAAIDRVLEAENSLKRLHLRMLIQVRNTLDSDQIGALEKVHGNRIYLRPMSMGAAPGVRVNGP